MSNNKIWQARLGQVEEISRYAIVDMRKKHESLKKVKLSLEEVKREIQRESVYESGLTKFQEACSHGLYDAVRVFLEEGQNPNSIVKRTGESPIHLALKNLNWSVPRLLLKRGADPNLSDSEGTSILHILCNRGSGDQALQFFKITDELYKPVHIDVQDYLGRRPLHFALANGLHRIVDQLLRRGADPNKADRRGWTPLHYVSNRFRCNIYFVQILFNLDLNGDQEIQIDAQNNLGNTALHLALKSENKELCEFLLRLGADPNLSNERGVTPLHIVCEKPKYDDLAETLIQVAIALERPLQIDARDKNGNTPLLLALQSDKKKVAKLLLKYDADPNLANAQRLTPLHIICQRDSSDDFAKIFFEISDSKSNKLQVDVRDEFGRTPLQWAVANLVPGSVELILKHGADVSNFVFLAEGYFARERNLSFGFNTWVKCSLKVAASLLSIIDQLKKKGFVLDESEAMMVMTFLVELDVFEQLSEFLEFLPKIEKMPDDLLWFKVQAQNYMVKPNLSLCDLIHLPIDKAARLLTFQDYIDIANEENAFFLDNIEGRLVVAHLCEMMSRKFFRRWALGPLYELAQYQLPVLCCEKILEKFVMNKDLWTLICLGMANRSS